MPRKRVELGSDVEKRISSLVARGETAEGIAAALRAKGVKVSRATIDRRVRELRGKVRSGRVSSSRRSPRSSTVEESPPSSAASPVSDAVVEGRSLAQLTLLFEEAVSRAQRAVKRKDIAAFSAMSLRATQLSEAIRKATPPEKPDPNENPDMKKLGERALERLHKYIDQVIEP